MVFSQYYRTFLIKLNLRLRSKSKLLSNVTYNANQLISRVSATAHRPLYNGGPLYYAILDFLIQTKLCILGIDI